ncbi:COMM domain-containing protein 4 [Dermatophagoides farinae]|uniref:COMM domain-containing protein 4 n=1 Tax=Dermatophagoides farinae TaxID=6954 RepID=A0A922I313_DERFA|nr:COMM domain-containing protein 4 [Dermatophagoides farinae]
MKFKFCGDNDCQDWILAQINVFSKLTSIKLKLILKEVMQHILTGKLHLQNVCKLTADAKLNEEETKAILAALNFIILSSIKYETDSETLSNELQQLGLPKEHSITLSKAYADKFNEIIQMTREKSLQMNPMLECSYKIISKFNNETMSVHCPSLFLSIRTNPTTTTNETSTFHVIPEKLTCLISDLKEVEKMMNESTY